MALHGRDWIELNDLLREKIGEPAAGKLMDFLPPAGWADVATKTDLVALEHRLHAEILTATQSVIRWVVGLVVPALIAGVGVTAAVTAALVRG